MFLVSCPVFCFPRNFSLPAFAWRSFPRSTDLDGKEGLLVVLNRKVVSFELGYR